MRETHLPILRYDESSAEGAGRFDVFGPVRSTVEDVAGEKGVDGPRGRRCRRSEFQDCLQLGAGPNRAASRPVSASCRDIRNLCPENNSSRKIKYFYKIVKVLLTRISQFCRISSVTLTVRKNFAQTRPPAA